MQLREALECELGEDEPDLLSEPFRLPVASGVRRDHEQRGPGGHTDMEAIDELGGRRAFEPEISERRARHDVAPHELAERRQRVRLGAARAPRRLTDNDRRLGSVKRRLDQRDARAGDDARREKREGEAPPGGNSRHCPTLPRA